MPELIINARQASISETLSVQRILPFRRKRMVGPFIFMDHAGPVDKTPTVISSLDVLPHPHIGLSTVTYLFGGTVTHRDSLGVEQVIKPGEVNWMTAGKGITHSERFDDPNALAGGTLEMMQTWVALPKEDEEQSPTFNNFSSDSLPVYTDKGIWMRLVAGNAYGLNNSVEVHSPLCYLHVKLEADVRFGLPKEHSEKAVYIVKGSIEILGENYKAGQMIVFKKKEDPIIRAKEKSVLMLLGGEPLGERYIWWNFVSSSKERIEQAKNDWRQGRMTLPQLDNQEFIPLPDERSKPSDPPPAPLLS